MLSDRNDVLWLTGDSPDIAALFDSASADRLSLFFGNKKIIVIDEAQRIPDIGIRMKLITDHIKDVQLIATGSSSFELANNINESLQKKWEYRMFPFRSEKWFNHHGLLTENGLLTTACSLLPRRDYHPVKNRHFLN
jgi:predicted AAA+ superfamily ATPase